MNYIIAIDGIISDEEVPNLREKIGWDRRDSDYPMLFERCNFWCSVRNEDNLLIGFGYICGMGLQHGYMEDIIVHHDYRHQGLGGIIVERLLDEAKKRSIEIVTLTFSKDKEKFYQTNGFDMCLGGVWRNE
jgi:GNAT superfamily N-acetyltransferase